MDALQSNKRSCEKSHPNAAFDRQPSRIIQYYSLETRCAAQGVRDQTRFLGFFEHAMRPLFVGVIRKPKRCAKRELRELRLTVATLEGALHVARQRSPVELRSPGDRAKSEDETSGERRDQQGFR